MRIRKHARISSPSAAAQPDTQVCQLNRSPWDIISFNTSPQSNYKYQVKREDNKYTCVERGSESAYAPDSVYSVEERCWDKVPKKVKEEMEEVYDEMEEEEERRLFLSVTKKKGKKKVKVKREPDYITCAKTDGKGWYCKNEAREGELLCEHHIIQLQSYHGKYNLSRKSIKVKPAAPIVRQKVKTVVAANKRENRGRVSSASPADFYYYSGFGPSWGKKRAGENEIKKEDMEVSRDANEQTGSSIVHVGHTGIANYDDKNDHIEDEFYDDEEDKDDDEHGGKKRIRRPIKARSLRSII